MISDQTRRILLLYFLQTVHSLADVKDSGICVQGKNTTRCCVNYVYDVSVKECVECIGRFGNDCSKECPDGFYGRSCNSKCNCSNETCNKISGCLKSRQGMKDGICNDKENGTYCCVNYMFLKTEHKCQECVGRFGVNCSEKCPEGYYGKQCREKCACSASQCDEILGCLKAPSEFHGKQQSISVYILQVVVPASVATGVLLLCILLGYHYRSKKKGSTEIHTSDTTITSMELQERQEYHASTSTAVQRPKKKRMNSILQHDITYDNTLFLQNSNHETPNVTCSISRYKGRHEMGNADMIYSMCSEFENIYDDTLCMDSSLAQSVERIQSHETEC